VVAQYILVLRAFALYDAAKVRVALAERLYEQASSLQRTGIGLAIDTTRAQVELQNERQNLIEAETATHTTNYILAELLDLPRDQEPLVTDKLQFFNLPEFEKTAAINTAFANRPEMLAQASQERITSLERKSASEERLILQSRLLSYIDIYWGLAVLAAVVAILLIFARAKRASTAHLHFHPL
jgi:outer membrane protein